MSWATKFARPYRVEHGKKFRLKDFDPADTAKLHSQEHAQELLAKGIARMAELQDKLYAQDRWGLLLIFQAMDAAGKDGVIRHVMSGINPQGCQVFSFKHPSATELDHDFLWRTTQCLPERGRIGVFNRSYYEEVLIVRVHPEILRNQGIPPKLLNEKTIWKERYQSILDFEKHLYRNGTKVLKFFLHISKEEQRKRFISRIDDPAKNWKFNEGDMQERDLWGEYLTAYEECLSATSTRHAPWYVVPADDKENGRLIVSQVVLNEFRDLDLRYPKPSASRLEELKTIRKKLVKEE